MPQNAVKRAHVSIAPPHLCVKRDALELRERREEVLGQHRERRGPLVELVAQAVAPVVDRVVAAPEDAVVLGQAVVVELVAGVADALAPFASRWPRAARWLSGSVIST